MTTRRCVGIVLACAMQGWGVSGCVCPDACYESLVDSPAVSLPDDEARHCYAAEWWYYTGLLSASDGREYGFEAVIFHTAPGVFAVTPEGSPIALPVNTYVAHFAIVDVADQAFAYAQERTILPQPVVGDGFQFITPLLTLVGGDGRDYVSGAMTDGSYALDLVLADDGEPVLHGGDGYIRYGTDGGAFYYSRPRLSVTGFLRDGDEVLAVNGRAWFDRQWGRDVRNPFLKWAWFSIRLDDGTALMLYHFVDGDASLDQGTLSEANSSVAFGLESGDFTMNGVEFWTSPNSGATYPVRWDVEVPSAGLTLGVNRVLDDQELDTRATTLNVYWEGLCWVAGTRHGEPVGGHAYVEMTNFDLR